MFTPQEILARVNRTPFAPFEIITSAGETHSVRHPELIMVGARFVTVGIDTPQAPRIAEMQTFVALIHITEIRDLAVAVSTGSNGTA